LWAIQGRIPATPLALDYRESAQEEVPLPAESPAQACVADYAQLGLSLGLHPLAFLRPRLEREGYRCVSRLRQARTRSRQTLAGLVINRQRPGTAKGTIFLTLEDETGMLNVIVRGDLVEAHRRVLLQAQLLGVRGTLEREGEVVHLIASQLRDLSPWLGRLTLSSRDFH
jgi:error-prone DNA polymerase